MQEKGAPLSLPAQAGDAQARDLTGRVFDKDGVVYTIVQPDLLTPGSWLVSGSDRSLWSLTDAAIRGYLAMTGTAGHTVRPS